MLVYLGGALGVNTSLMYGHFNTIPREIDAAVVIDGAGHLWIFLTIVLTQIQPVLVAVGMLAYISVADDFVIASVVLTRTTEQPTAVGLFNTRCGGRG